MEIEAVSVLKTRASLGEGSLWDWRAKRLHWVDIKGFAIHTFEPESAQDTAIDTGEFVSTVVRRVPEHGDGLIIALTLCVAHVQESSGKITRLIDIPEPSGNRLNDGKCDARGRLWVGSLNLQETPGAGALYMVDCDHKVYKKLSGTTISNGIVWSRDNRTMFFIDTGKNSIDAFDFDIESGAISNRRELVKNVWGGHFDGMTIDDSDNIFVALWGGARVLKLGTKSGWLLGTVHVPGALNVTSCAFGGPDLNELYITSSAEGADFAGLPNAGNLFKAQLPDSKGLPAYEFAG